MSKFLRLRLWLRWCLAWASVCALTSAAHAAPAVSGVGGDVVRFAPERDYGPFVYQAADGSIQGLSVDLLARIADLGALRVSTLPARPLAQNLAAVRRGEVDLLSSLRPTPERAQYLAFTRPYVEVAAIVVGRPGSPAPDLAQLQGRPVAVGLGYAVESFVRQRYPKVQWLAVPDDHVALQRLLAGEVSAVVADVASVAFIARQHGWDALVPGRPVGFNYALSFAYPKDRPEIGAALERGLKALPPAEQERLLARWIPARTEAGVDDRPHWLSALGLMIFLAGAGLLWRLRRPPLPRSVPIGPIDAGAQR